MDEISNILTRYGSCHITTNDASLFVVTNTSGKRQLVVAADFDCALWLSRCSGHIRDIKNGKIGRVSEKWLLKDEPFQSSVRRAVAAGTPGPIERNGNVAIIRENSNFGVSGGVFLPISSVKTN